MTLRRPPLQKLAALFCLLFLLHLWFPLAGPALQTGEDGRWMEVCSSSLAATKTAATTTRNPHQHDGSPQHCPDCLTPLAQKLMTAETVSPAPVVVQHPEMLPFRASGLDSLPFLPFFDTRAPPPVI